MTTNYDAKHFPHTLQHTVWVFVKDLSIKR